MRTTLVHAADLHVDSPLRGLPSYEGAPREQVVTATRGALRALIDLCLARDAKLLLLAGDLFDGDWRDYSTGLFFLAELKRLREVGCQVVLVRGNHDAASQMRSALRWPEHVIELSTAKPEVLRFEPLGISVTGQGFAKRGESGDLAASYPSPDRELFSIAMLHTSLDGREGHDTYAPTKLSTVLDRGYDYWALGHVHAREDVAENVVFPGNLQGRHARETGPKGAMVLELEDNRLLRREFVPLDVVRWQQLEVDAAAAASVDDAIELACAALERAIEPGRLLASRLHWVGRSELPLRAHAELVLAQLRERMQGAPVYLEDVRVRTRPLGERRTHPLAEPLQSLAPWARERVAALLAELPDELAHDVRASVAFDEALGDSALQLALEKLTEPD